MYIDTIEHCNIILLMTGGHQGRGLSPQCLLVWLNDDDDDDDEFQFNALL